jgi:hypothetical protein
MQSCVGAAVPPIKHRRWYTPNCLLIDIRDIYKGGGRAGVREHILMINCLAYITTKKELAVIIILDRLTMYCILIKVFFVFTLQ